MTLKSYRVQKSKERQPREHWPLAIMRPMGTRRRGRTFSYEEALATFPLVRDLTSRAVSEVEALTTQIQSLDEAEARKQELESAYNTIVQGWVAEVSGLGCEVKGLWLVDWDSGDGYYCWQFPETTLAHYHDYDSGFAGRIPIT